MAKKYRFFYAADILTVLSDAPLGPLTPTALNGPIDAFEARLLKSKQKGPSFNKEVIDLKQEEETEGLDDIFALEQEAINSPSEIIDSSNNAMSSNNAIKYRVDPREATETGPAWIYGGARFEETLLLTNYLYMNLGLLLDSDLSALRKKVTFRRYRTFAAAASLEIFSEVAFKWVPQDPTKTRSPYGLSYSTYLPYAGRKTFADVRSIVEGLTMNVGTEEIPIIYEVLPESVKPRRLKTYSPL